MGKLGYGKDTAGSFLRCLLTVPCTGKVEWRVQRSVWVWVHQDVTVAFRRMATCLFVAGGHSQGAGSKRCGRSCPGCQRGEIKTLECHSFGEARNFPSAHPLLPYTLEG